MGYFRLGVAAVGEVGGVGQGIVAEIEQLQVFECGEDFLDLVPAHELVLGQVELEDVAAAVFELFVITDLIQVFVGHDQTFDRCHDQAGLGLPRRAHRWNKEGDFRGEALAIVVRDA